MGCTKECWGSWQLSLWGHSWWSLISNSNWEKCPKTRGKQAVNVGARRAVRWTENWLNGQAQWVVTNGTKSTRGPVTGGTHHRLMLGAILVNTITKDLDDGCSVPSQNWEEQLTCQRSCCHLEGPWQLEKWADRRNLRKFNKEKCKDLHLVRNNPRHPAGDQLGRRGPEVPVGYPVEQDTACLCSKWLPAGGGRSPFLSAQHWWTCTWSVGASAGHTDVEKRVKLRAREMEGLEHLFYEEKLRKLWLFSLQKRRVRGDLTNVYKSLKWQCKKNTARLISVVCSDRTRGSRHKMKHSRLRLNISELFFFKLCRWPSTCTGWPERLWSLSSCRSSKSAWITSWTTCSGWPYLSTDVGKDVFHRSIPTSTILWFYRFMISNQDICLTKSLLRVKKEFTDPLHLFLLNSMLSEHFYFKIYWKSTFY